MGISKATTQIFLQESLRRPLEGRVLQLGRQAIYVSEDMVRNLATQLGAKLHKLQKTELSSDTNSAAQGFLLDRSFFGLLGFSECESLDCSDYEGADHIFDLNAPAVPDHLRNRFDFIFNGGTIEHVFHLPNVLANIFAMLRVGGRILHLAPSSNNIDHGFYMFSPTFFTDFYAANKYEINLAQIVRITPGHDLDQPWLATNYKPGSLDHREPSDFDDGLYVIFFIATKTAESTASVIPQQGFYTRYHAGMATTIRSPTNGSNVKKILGTLPVDVEY
jgi:SAM-dependent methyltransferase